MTIVWSPPAIDDLAALRAFVSEDNPKAAQAVALRILALIENVLARNPAAGRPGPVPGTRELAVTGTPYIVPYRVRGDTLEILRVYHGARRWPGAF